LGGRAIFNRICVQYRRQGGLEARYCATGGRENSEVCGAFLGVPYQEIGVTRVKKKESQPSHWIRVSPPIPNSDVEKKKEGGPALVVTEKRKEVKGEGKTEEFCRYQT